MDDTPERQPTFLRRARNAWWVVALAGLAGIGYAAVETVFLRQSDPISRTSFDWIQRFRERHEFSNLFLVEIDSRALRQYGDPIDRARFADLIDRSVTNGVRLVFFDLVFNEKHAQEQDLRLAASLAKASNVVIGGGVYRRPTEFGTVIDTKPGRVGVVVTEAMAPLPEFLVNPARNWGLLDLTLDPDGVVRRLNGRFNLFQGKGNPEYLTAPWVAAKRLKIEVSDESGERWLRYYGPAKTVFRSEGLADAIEFPERLAGAEMIFVGVNQERMASSLQGPSGRDEYRSPYGGDYHAGLELQATAVLNLARGDVLVRKSVVFQVFVSLVWASLAVGLLTLRRALWMQAVVAGLGIALGGVWVALAVRGGYWWPWLVPAGLQTMVACLLSPLIPAPPLGRPKVFISYSGPNKADPNHRHGAGHARAIREALHRRRIPAYFAPEQMRVGDRFQEELPAAIVQAPCFLLILTPGAVTELSDPKSWVRREVDVALAERRRNGRPRLMVVRTVGHGERVLPLKQLSLPEGLSELTQGHDVELDLERNFESAIHEIVRGLA